MDIRRGGMKRSAARAGRAAVLLLAVALAGCSSGAPPVSPTPPVPSPAATSAPGSPAPALSGSPVASRPASGAPDRADACSPTVGPGDTWVQFQADGQQRKALLHLPPGTPAGPLPAIVALHGYSSWAEDFARYSHLSDKADSSGFLVVYPQALGGTPEWQLFGIPSDNPENARSDQIFLTGVVEWLTASHCVDAGRIFLAGHSQGGGMASDASCMLGERIAGIGLVSAVQLRTPCEPRQPVPAVAFHAVDDPVLPYRGGPVDGAPDSYPHQLPIESTLARRAADYSCGAKPANATLGDGTVQVTWQGCRAPLVFYRLATGGHDWASTTADRLWAFFSSLPARRN